MNQNTLFIIVFIVFIAFLFAVSFIAKGWVKETDDYVLAGRQISTPLNVFGVIAIGFAGTTIALSPGFAVQYGLFGSVVWGGIYSFVGLALYGILFSNFIRRSGAQTLPEYLEMRYDGTTRSIVAFTSVFGMLGIMANNIVSCVNNICAYTGWSAAVVTAVIYLIILIFTYISGMWAISMTDFVQVILGIVVVPLVFFLCIQKYGFWDAIVANWPTASPAMSGFVGSVPGLKITYPSILNFIILFAAALVWGNNYYWMKIANCRSEKVAKSSFIWAAVLLFIIFCFPLAMIGLYMGAFHGDLLTFMGGAVAPTGAYGFIASTLLPLFGSLAVIGAVAASISTSATSALGSSAIMTRDIYSRIINPNADAKKKMNASRIALVITAVVTFVLCQFPGGPTYLFAFSNCWLVPPAVLVGLGIVWKKFNKTGAIAGAVAGMVAMAVLELLELLKIFVIGQFIYLATIGFIITLVVAIIGSLVGKKPYYGEDSWELVPTESNRVDTEINETDAEVLKLIRLGHKYMADITDYLGVDSKFTNAAIEKLDKAGLIQRAGLSGHAFYTFTITAKGDAALGALEGIEAELCAAKLSPMYLDLLKAIATSAAEEQAWIKKNSIRSMQMAAISSHLTREGYILEKGWFQRKLELTQKGKDAVAKF